MICSDAVARARAVPAIEVARLVRLERPRRGERDKRSCPSCGSSDALHLYPDQRGAHCFSCGANFDSIALVRAALQVDFPSAVAFLTGAQSEFRPPSPRPRAGLTGGGSDREPGDDDDELVTASERTDEWRDETALSRRREAARQALARVYSELRLEEDGAAYLASRGLPRDVEAVGIRSVSPRGWREVIGDLDPRVASDAGLRRPGGSQHPTVGRHALVFPLHQGEELLVGLRVREVGPGRNCLSLRRGLLEPVPAPFLFSRAARVALETGRLLLVVEGELDALSCVVAGLPAIGSPGASCWRADWWRVLGSIRRVAVVGDPDEAGRRFVERVVKTAIGVLGADWCAERLLDFTWPAGPGGEKRDANDLLQVGLLPAVLGRIEAAFTAKACVPPVRGSALIGNNHA